MKLIKQILLFLSLLFLLYLALGTLFLLVPDHDIYTYAGEDVLVMDGKIASSHEIPIDSLQWEYIGATDCPITESIMRSRHAQQKFNSFKKTISAMDVNEIYLNSIASSQIVKVKFLKQEPTGLSIDWGIECEISNPDTSLIELIGYIDRGSGDPVMYHQHHLDSTEQYYGYNNLLYNKLKESILNHGYAFISI